MRRTNFVESENAVWMKGNLHAHSTCSDGHLMPRELVKGYKSKGYDFLALTDHDVFYAHPELCEDGFIVLPAMELTAPLTEDKNAHIGVLLRGEKGGIGQGQRFQLTNRSEVLEFIEKYHRDYLLILNHPYWSLLEWEEVIDVPHLTAMEIYNNGCELGDLVGEASHFWNTCLRKGKKLWAVAADDCHNAAEKDPGWPFESLSCDSFGGWICVKAKERSAKGIMEAVEAGSFYASTGPEIHDFYVEDEMFHVKCSPCQRIIVSGDRGYFQRKYGFGVTEFHKKLKGKEKYVRVQCVDEKGRMASSNPIYLA